MKQQNEHRSLRPRSRFERGRKEIGGRTGHAALMNAILKSAAQLGGKDEVVSYFKGLAQNRPCTFGKLLLKLIPKPSRPTRASRSESAGSDGDPRDDQKSMIGGCSNSYI